MHEQTCGCLYICVPTICSQFWCELFCCDYFTSFWWIHMTYWPISFRVDSLVIWLPLCQWRDAGRYWWTRPEAHFTNVFLLAHQIRWKFHPCCNSVTGHQVATRFCKCHDSYAAVVTCAKFCAIRQHAITRANVDTELYRHMGSLGHSE